MSAVGNTLRSIVSVFPSVVKPVKKKSLNERLIWTVGALLLYLVMSQIPLYGVASGMEDQMSYTSIIFATAQGTLVHLGIGPIVTAGLVLQLLKGADIIPLNFKDPADRALFSSSTKVLALFITFVEGIAFMIGGQFGTGLSGTTQVIIIAQLVLAGFVILLLDELVQKGWGIGSGISLFIAAGVAQQVFWSIFSVLPTGDGYFGVIPYFVQSLLNGNVGSAVMRSNNLPSLITLFLTLAIIALIVYTEGIRIELPITSTKMRGFQGTYPIKLLYVSVLPVILTGALMANIMFFSQFIWSRYNPASNVSYLNWIGIYNPENPSSGAIGGLAYYISPARGIQSLSAEPLHVVTYVLFFMIMCVIFSRIWVEVAGLGPSKVAENLLGANVQVPGFRNRKSSVEIILNKYIPVITIIGGALMGLLAAGSDILGIFGSGTGILLMVSITLNFYQQLMKEQLETMMPQLAGLLGKG